MMKTGGIRKALRYFIKKNTPKDNNSIATDKASNGFDLERPEISYTVTNCLSSLLNIIIKENTPRVAKV